ncbi:MAG: T9SS type A sorting domain-containing protein [Ignavibacteria bacterium]|nr:T9SS type A sorting domain-containing protein [Ignavibacteria bacterium]
MIVATGSGELRKTFTGTGSFTFPVGDNTGTAEYSPVTLNFTSGSFSSAYAGVKLANSKHPNNTSSTDYINRYWTVSSSGISSFSCDASFVYVAADVEGTESNLYCGSWGGSSWTLLNAVNTGTKTLSGTVSSFSDFTGGETSALPVQLTSFSATANRLDAVLRWATATEVSNYGFEIERRLASTSLSLTSTSLSPTSTSLSLTSTPLSPTSTSLSLTSTPLSLAIGSWMRIGFVEGAGTSNAPRDYSFTDKNVPPGRYAYRIKQIDHDGTFEYFGDAEVEIGLAPKKFTLSEGYPNPFNSTTTIEFTLPEDGRAILSVYNMLGQQVATLFDGETFAGRIMQAKFDASRFPSGIYFSRLEFGGKALTRKIVLMR